MTNPEIKILRWSLCWCLAGLVTVGCNLGYDPESVPLDTAQDTVSDSATGDLDAPTDTSGEDPTIDSSDLADQRDQSDPVEPDLPADTTSDLADVIESDTEADTQDVQEEEVEPGPCDPVACVSAPAPVVHWDDFELYSEGANPCAWLGIPVAEGTPLPKVVGVPGTDDQILESVGTSVGAGFDFEDMTVPFIVEFEFRASTIGTQGTVDGFCLVSQDNEDCLIEVGYAYITRAFRAYYQQNGPQPAKVGVIPIDPQTWHRFTLLVRPFGSENGGTFDLWVDGIFGGVDVPIAAPNGVDDAVISRLGFWKDGSPERPPLAIDDLYIAPLDCDTWSGHSTCERQRPVVRLALAAAANLWVANAVGTTTGAEDLYSGSCQAGELSGADEVVPFLVPTSLVSLKVTTTDTAFDPLLYIRSNCSDPDSELSNGCNDDTSEDDVQSTVSLCNVERGAYFAIIDGADAGEEGNYSLHFSGTTAGTCP